MSVITDKLDEDHWTRGATCSFCCEEIVSYPFLFWLSDSDTPVCVCGKCCVRVRAGLIADIEQIVAIKKLQEQCPRCTLVRAAVGDLDRPDINSKRKSR